ncbi:hypothetical protein NP493_1168g00003 [Ridgeia piscesae]|uniref:Uncharacterized protein n=1 Tax=Ridgeia piscesae TaxID=27915 RepID=A0AAD9KFQ1_RIDPI|nr:hypothetical protein NP493_1168g00003 [Ridgeia piscesae]
MIFILAANLTVTAAMTAACQPLMVTNQKRSFTRSSYDVFLPYVVIIVFGVIVSSSCCLSATRVGAYAVLYVLPSSVVCQLYLTSGILRQMHVLPPVVEVCNRKTTTQIRLCYLSRQSVTNACVLLPTQHHTRVEPTLLWEIGHWT